MVFTELSVIIPVYNQEKNIEKNMIRLKACLEKKYNEFEIIAVNDGSCDKSLDILRRLKFVHVITYPKNRGKGYAVRRGVMAARGKYIFFTDADLSYSPNEIFRALRLLETEQSDGVIGVRNFKKSEYPPLRRFISDVFSFIVKNVLRLDFKDSQCGFKGFKKTCARNIFPRLTVFRFGFDVELLLEAKYDGLKLSALPVHFTHFESSSVKPFKDSREMLFSLFKIKKRFSRRSF